MTINVRVGKLPGRIIEVVLEDGARSVADALSAAELDASGFETRVNSTPREAGHQLNNGDLVLLVKQIKGNLGHITVRVGKLPGRIEEIALNGDRKVSTALEAAGLDATGFEIRVNSTPRGTDHELANGDLVLLVKQIKGNEQA